MRTCKICNWSSDRVDFPPMGQQCTPCLNAKQNARNVERRRLANSPDVSVESIIRGTFSPVHQTTVPEPASSPATAQATYQAPSGVVYRGVGHG